MIFIISEPEKDLRLDKFLVLKFPFLSRSQIQRAIEHRQVLVNEKKIAKHYFLKINDQLKILFDPNEVKKKVAIDLTPNKKIKLDIIFEDENYLVINKPANLIIHQSEIHPESDTLTNALLAHLPGLKDIGDDKMRPGIVHRLDKGVSGLLIIAKTEAAFSDLKKQFKNKEIYKEYVALVYGIPSQKHKIIDFNIARSKTDGRKMAAKPRTIRCEGKPDATGKEAITEYEVIKEFQNYALLKVIIHTGRTHQIRVHLSALNYPIVGETIYHPKSLRTNVKLHRLFLHSTALKFKDLDGKTLEFKLALPKELRELLANLS